MERDQRKDKELNIKDYREDFRTLEFKNDRLYLIDQRILPNDFSILPFETSEEVAFAIKDMIVRGAPAIGGAAGYGIYFAAKECRGNFDEFLIKAEIVRSSRPTAVNLMWAVDRMVKKAKETNLDLESLRKEADSIVEEDLEMNYEMSRIGNEIVRPNATILTHCNAGALATCGWGTALGVIKYAHYSGKNIFVYADETRPRLQGARLTAWELIRANIPSKLIPDGAAATLIRDGKIDCVIVGADRIAANGDVANKLGTFALSVISKHYGVPFYMVAPITTIDFNCPSGSYIPIEERDKNEVRQIEGIYTCPKEMDVLNPCFDVTPHQNITGIITEKGIIRPPFDINIEKIKKGKSLF